jgi:hypothetical protein
LAYLDGEKLSETNMNRFIHFFLEEQRLKWKVYLVSGCIAFVYGLVNVLGLHRPEDRVGIETILVVLTLTTVYVAAYVAKGRTLPVAGGQTLNVRVPFSWRLAGVGTVAITLLLSFYEASIHVLQPKLDARSLQRLAAGPHTRQNLNQIDIILENSKRSGTRIDKTTISNAGAKLITASKSEPQAWNAALSFLNYQSYLNKSGTTRPSDLVPYVSGLRKGEMTSNVYSDNPPAHVAIFISRTIVPAEQMARAEVLFKNPSREQTEGPDHVVIQLQQGDRTILDGFHYKNVIFENAHIIYNGGPVILENVGFVNCTFSIKITPNTLNLADKILSDPSTTFKSSG